MQIKFVIPCYNEEQRLPVQDYVDYFSRSEAHPAIFVDDGSTDRTLTILNDLAHRFPGKVEVLPLERNKGKAEAVRTGVNRALQGQDSDWIGYIDADLATHPDEFRHLLSEVPPGARPDLIMGSRVKLHGSTEIKRKTLRHYLGRIFATGASRVLQLDVYDTQCGAKLIKWEKAEELFSEPFTSKWLFDVELICRLMGIVGRSNIEEKLQEIPVQKWVEKGHSKVKFYDGLKVPIELSKIKNRYKKELRTP